MKPSTNQRDIGGRRVESRIATAGAQAGQTGLPEGIPPYLLNPEGLEAPLPEVTELLPEAPAARKATGAPLPPSLRTTPPAHREPMRHGFDPHGLKQRHSPIAPLREHRVHGRGQ